MTGSVVIVDDHEEFRVAATGLLRSAGWSVVAQAADADEAIRVVAEKSPELVLLDVGLATGGPDGIDVAHVLAALDPPPRVVLVSARDRGYYGERLAQAPVAGFIAKASLSAAVLSDPELGGSDDDG